MEAIHTLSLLEMPEIEGGFRPDAEIVLCCGDTLDLLRNIPDGTAKLIITSPPYNLGKEYEDRQRIEAYLAEQETVIDELVRVVRQDGSLCWQVGNHVQDGYIVALDTVAHKQHAAHSGTSIGPNRNRMPSTGEQRQCPI